MLYVIKFVLSKCSMAQPTLERPNHDHFNPTVCPTHSAISGVVVSFPIFSQITSHVSQLGGHLLYQLRLQCACLRHQEKVWASMRPLRQRATHKRAKYIELTAILVSNYMFVTIKTNYGNCDI